MEVHTAAEKDAKVVARRNAFRDALRGRAIEQNHAMFANAAQRKRRKNVRTIQHAREPTEQAFCLRREAK
jgi:hypothetical protein